VATPAAAADVGPPQRRGVSFSGAPIDRTVLLILPALLYLLVVFLVPLGALVLESVSGPTGFDVSAYADFLGEAHSRAAIFNTLEFAVWVSAISLIIGLPFAYVMTHLSNRAQAVILVLILLPMASSIVVRTFGWTVLLRRDGLVNELLVFAGIVDEPVRLIFTRIGLVLGGVSTLLPLMILPIYSVLRMIPADLGQAASCLGASNSYTFRHVTLPLCMPGVVVGIAFVFAQAAAAYVLPLLLGGRRFRTMSTTVVDSYLVVQNNALGAAVSVMLLAIVILVVVGCGLLGRRWKGAV
jgi:putative spermidine/putrescine transport system permease protein